MESVVRGLAIYFIVWLIFRIAGKRSLAEITTFDFVLVLIIAETTQQAMLGPDYSITNALLLIVTLVGADIALSLAKQRSKLIEKILDGVPVVIMEDGKLHKDRMDKARVDEEDILNAARELRGLERLDQIRYAVLERSGGISVVPWRNENRMPTTAPRTTAS